MGRNQYFWGQNSVTEKWFSIILVLSKLVQLPTPYYPPLGLYLNLSVVVSSLNLQM